MCKLNNESRILHFRQTIDHHYLKISVGIKYLNPFGHCWSIQEKWSSQFLNLNMGISIHDSNDVVTIYWQTYINENSDAPEWYL